MLCLPGAGYLQRSLESISVRWRWKEQTNHRFLLGLPQPCGAVRCGPRLGNLPSPGTKGEGPTGTGGGAARGHVTDQPPAAGGAARVLRGSPVRGRERLGSARRLQAQAVVLLSVSLPGAQWLRRGSPFGWGPGSGLIGGGGDRPLACPGRRRGSSAALDAARRGGSRSSGRGDLGSGTLLRQSSGPSRFRAQPGDPAVVGFFPVALAHFKGGGGDFGELRGRSLKGRVRPWPSQLADCESLSGVLRASIDLHVVQVCGLF